ncbi:MAG: hypothetical protein QW548_00930 [Candidatus Aenigmatarchaeota archaeon]
MLLSIAACAFLGGCVRAALGIRKYGLKRGQISSMIVDGITGAVCGLAFMYVANLSGPAALWASGLAGYVGADIFGSLYKIRIKRGGTLV